MKLFVFVCILGVSLSQSIFAAGDADFRAIQKASDQLQRMNKPQSTCVDCAFGDKGNSCFDFLNKVQIDDFSHVVATIDGGAKKCQSSVSLPSIEKRFANVQELQNHYRKTYPELGNLNHNQIQACANGKDEPDGSSRYKTGKFYYFMKKFNEGATRAVEEIAAINRLLGDSSKIKCVGKGTIPQAFNRCEELNRECGPKSRGRGQDSELTLAAKESERDEKLYADVQKDIQKLDSTCLEDKDYYQKHGKSLSASNLEMNHCVQGTGTRDFAKTCKKLTYEQKKTIEGCQKVRDGLYTQKLTIEEKNPWFKSENYHKLRKSKSVEESIKAHSLTNRTELQKKVNEFQDAGLCFNGFLDSNKCDIGKIRNLLAATPDIPKINKKDQQTISANIYLNVQACVEAKNEFNAMTRKELRGAAWDTALILATAGLGSYAVGVKSISSGAKATANARRALAAVWGGDAYYASQSYIDVAKSCIGTAQKIEIAAQSAGKSCPGPRSNVSQAQKEHSNCMMAAAMAAIDTAVVGLPGVSLLAKHSYNKNLSNSLAREVGAGGKAPTEVATADTAVRTPEKPEAQTVSEKLNQMIGRKDPFVTGEAKEIGATYKDFLKDLPEDHGEVITLISQARRNGVPETKIKEVISSCTKQ